MTRCLADSPSNFRPAPAQCHDCPADDILLSAGQHLAGVAQLRPVTALRVLIRSCAEADIGILLGQSVSLYSDCGLNDRAKDSHAVQFLPANQLGEQAGLAPALFLARQLRELDQGLPLARALTWHVRPGGRRRPLRIIDIHRLILCRLRRANNMSRAVGGTDGAQSHHRTRLGQR